MSEDGVNLNDGVLVNGDEVLVNGDEVLVNGDEVLVNEDEVPVNESERVDDHDHGHGLECPGLECHGLASERRDDGHDYVHVHVPAHDRDPDRCCQWRKHDVQ